LVMFSKNIFSDFCHTNYLNIYRANLHEICRIGRSLAADEELKLFFTPPRDVAVATNFVNKIDLHSTPCSSHELR